MYIQKFLKILCRFHGISLEIVRLLLQIAYEWSHGQQKNLWLPSFVLQFQQFVARFEFQNVYMIPHLPDFNFWTQKIKTKPLC